MSLHLIPTAMVNGASRFLQNNGSAGEEEKEEEAICCIAYGIIIYILGAIFIALGVNVQKYSINREHMRFPEENDPRRRGLWRQPLWVTGLILYASSGGLLSAALIFAAQSQLAPLMSIVIISNALLARVLLNESVCRRDMKAILIIIVAVIVTTLNAPQSTEKYDTEELIELYREPSFFIFLFFLLALLFAFYIANKFVLAKVTADPPPSAKYVLNVLKGDASHVPQYQEKLFAFSFGAQAGLWGGLTVTMMKSAISIIIEEIETDGLGGIFTNGLAYALTFVLIICWTFQLYWINTGLERYPAVFVVSIEAVLNELVAVVGGVLYFQEFALFTPESAVLFIFGLLLGVFGIFLFATRDNYNLEDDVFENCCPLKAIQNDPNLTAARQKPVDGDRRPSWKRGESIDFSQWTMSDQRRASVTRGSLTPSKSNFESDYTFNDASEMETPARPASTHFKTLGENPPSL